MADTVPQLRTSKPRLKEKAESWLTKFTEKNKLLDKLYYSSEESYDDATAGSGDVFYMKHKESNQHIPIKMEGLKELWKQSGKPDIGVGNSKTRAYYSPAADRGFLQALFGRDYIATSDPFGIGVANKNDIISELSHGLRYQDPIKHGYDSRRDMLRSSDKMRETAPVGSEGGAKLYSTKGNEEYDTHNITEPIIRNWLKKHYTWTE